MPRISNFSHGAVATLVEAVSLPSSAWICIITNCMAHRCQVCTESVGISSS